MIPVVIRPNLTRSISALPTAYTVRITNQNHAKSAMYLAKAAAGGVVKRSLIVSAVCLDDLLCILIS
jgi:hypothetical protein